MRIAYYTVGSQTRGSTRLRAIIPGRFLRTLGHEVIFNPTSIVAADVVVFQKRTDLIKLMRRYRRQGAFVVMDVSDYGQYPASEAAVTIVGTSHLKQWYKDAIVIPDVLDITNGVAPRVVHNEQLQQIVWFGTPENIIQAKPVAEACTKCKLNLTLISNHNSRTGIRIPRTHRRTWSLKTIDAQIVQYDLAVCPFILDDCAGFHSPRSQHYLECKSINRPLKAWALGLPVIGSPIPSYVECGVTHLATTVDEWMYKLTELRSKQLRVEDAARGSEISKAFRVEVIAERWLQLFSRGK